MRLSVIVSTYNSPGWLEKVLWGYSVQTQSAFEIIVADDGSTPETAAVIERMRTETGMSIKHVWQQDRGFRKCRVVNKAVLHAAGEYLVFTDGDCIPRADFLAVHAQEAAPGHYLSGSYFKLPLSISEAITRDDIVSQRCFSLRWLLGRGLPLGLRSIRLAAAPVPGRLLDRVTTTRCNFKGSNGSAWAADVLAVNGFDERMPWGGEDREFGERLRNFGILPRQIRHRAILLHLDHPRDYRNADSVAANKSLRMLTERQGIRHTPFGVAQLTEAGYRPRHETGDTGP